MTRPVQIVATVATGCHVTLPHPSGIKELAGRVLAGGETFQIDPGTADDLFRAGLIHHPVTGAAPVAPAALPRPYVPSGPRVFFGLPKAGPAPTGLTLVDEGMDWSAFAEPPRSDDRVPNPPPHNCYGPVIDRTRDTGW